MIKLNRLILFGLGLIGFSVYADKNPKTDDLQQQLNAQIMGQSFHVEDDAKLEAYLDSALKKGVAPVTTPSQHWRPGYTCANIRAYSWRDYRNCRYHYRYYGRYW